LVDNLERQPRQIETRYGVLDAPTPEQDLISRFLVANGEWGWDETTFVAAQVDGGARVLDGGAFLGTFGLGLAAQKRLDLLCAVEANPGLAEALRANLARNHAGPSLVLTAMITGLDPPEAIGACDGVNIGGLSFAPGAEGDMSVPAPANIVTLAELRERHGPFDLIKLDLEGMEIEALRGDEAFLSSGATTLWLECNEHPNSLLLLNLILPWGLNVHYFAAPSHNPANFRSLSEPILPWAYEAGLLVSRRQPAPLDRALTDHGCVLQTITSRADLEEAMWLTPRWLPAAYAHANITELAAVAGRALAAESRDHFLTAALTRASDPAAAATLTIGEARALAGERLASLDSEREQREQAEHGLSEARQRVADMEEALARVEESATARLTLLEREHRLRESAETALADAAALALERLEQVGRVEERYKELQTELEKLHRQQQIALRDLDLQISALRRDNEHQISELRRDNEHQISELRRDNEYLLAERTRQHESLAWRLYVFAEKLTRGLDRRRKRAPPTSGGARLSSTESDASRRP
jgi:FkbM family methyltransferase